MLARLRRPDNPVVFGVIRDVEAPTYDQALWDQIDEVKKDSKVNSVDELLMTGETWEIK